MSATTAPVAKRGYVLIRSTSPSAIVDKARALEMQRRFGGRVVLASGLRYRIAQRSLRVVVDADLPELMARPALEVSR